MNEEQVMHAMSIDDAYNVERVLAQSNLGITECVTFDGAGPFVRKKIPLELVNRKVWAALAECTSSRLPQIAVTYEMPDQFIVVYDFIPGDTLEHVVAANSRLNLDQTLSVVKELASALADLHNHHIVHCDVSPNNVIIAADGAHLIDFGIAQEIGNSSMQKGHVSSYGTWGFASPEQYGFAAADQRSDIYSLVRLMVYMLSGQMPDQGKSDQSLSSIDSVPGELLRIIEKGSAFEPSSRFQSCDEFLDAIAAFEAGRNLVMPSGDPNNVSGVSSAETSSDVSLETKHVSKSHQTLSELPRSKKLAFLVGASLLLCALIIACVLFVFQLFHDESQETTEQSSVLESPEEKSSSQVSRSFDSASSSGISEVSEGMLTIQDSGWSVDEYGLVHFGIALHNEDPSHGILFPSFSVVGYSSDGSIAFSDEHTLTYLQPGETLYYGSIAGDGSVIPASIEFSPVPPGSYDVIASESSRNAVFRAENVSAVSLYGGTRFTGEIKLDQGEYPDQGISGVLVTAILRDDNGNIVYGNSVDAEKPSENSSSTFDLSCFDAPDYTTYEIYACVW